MKNSPYIYMDIVLPNKLFAQKCVEVRKSVEMRIEVLKEAFRPQPRRQLLGSPRADPQKKFLKKYVIVPGTVFDPVVSFLYKTQYLA